MKTLITTMVLAIALSLVPGVAKAGTVALANAGFETGDQTGWFSWGGWRTVTGDYYHEGLKSLEIEDNDASNTTGAEQDFAVSNPADFYITTYTSWVKTGKNGVGLVGNAATKLQWFNGDTFISEVISSPLTGINDWTQLSVTSSAPSTATKGRISIVVDSGTLTSGAGNAFFDDASVTYTVPEPTSLLLLGSGLVGLLGISRRKN